MSSPFLEWPAVLLLASCLCHGRTLRVCADPNNLPFSNRAGAGFENRLAEILAHDLDAQLEYTWWSERKSFVKNSLNAGKCDVVPGIAVGTASVLATQPYYRSSYVFVSRKDRNLHISSLLDDRLSALKIGVHVVNDDYAPPAHALAGRGLSGNLVGFNLFGEYGEENPPAKLIDAVERGEVDVAIVWGPFAGFFAKSETAPLDIGPVTPPAWMGIPFTYDISMAVRPSDTALKDELDKVLAHECPAIRDLLSTYGIPTVTEDKPKCGESQQRFSVSLP